MLIRLIRSEQDICWQRDIRLLTYVIRFPYRSHRWPIFVSTVEFARRIPTEILHYRSSVRSLSKYRKIRGKIEISVW